MRRPVSRLFPFKIFPPRVISIFVKNKEETRRLASPISMLWEGDANSAPSSRKFITVSRCIPSSPSSNYASYPLLECDENHPLSPPWAPLVITPWKLDTKREAWQSYVCYVFRARPRISPIDCNPFSSPTDSVERAITRLLEEERRARMISPCGDRVALTPHNGVVIPVSPSSQQVDSPTLANFCLEFPRNCRGRPLAFHPISFDTFPSFPPN